MCASFVACVSLCFCSACANVSLLHACVCASVRVCAQSLRDTVLRFNILRMCIKTLMFCHACRSLETNM